MRKLIPYLGRERRRRSRPRAITIGQKMSRDTLAQLRLDTPDFDDSDRPRVRGDCVDAPRPCPWVACRYHLFIDVDQDSGSLKLNFPELEPWDLQHSCSLDIADLEGIKLEEVGAVLNVTRERARQIEVRALFKYRRNSAQLGIDAGDEVFPRPEGFPEGDETSQRAQWVKGRR